MSHWLVQLCHVDKEPQTQPPSPPPTVQANQKSDTQKNTLHTESLCAELKDEHSCYVYFFFGLVEVHPEYKVQVGLFVELTGRQGQDYITDLAVSHPGIIEEQNTDQGAKEAAPMIMVLGRGDCIKMIIIMKKGLGVLEMEGTAVAELLLQAYYLSQHSPYAVKEQVVCCLADLHHFHCFRLRRTQRQPPSV